MTALAYSCNLIPSPRIADEARVAERLGYTRVYVTDSPALYGDVWIALAQVAAATESIGIGTGVLVPHTRHPVVNAAAITSIESMAPGRLVVGIGSGNSARRCLGDRRPVTMRWLRDYIVTLRSLLRGESTEWEGKRVGLIPSDGYMPEFPIEVPLYLSAFGPKGLALARELADGLIGAPCSDFEDSLVCVIGTVLDDGESVSSERAIRAHAPMVLTTMHNLYEDDPSSLDTIPGGASWRDLVDEKVPKEIAHLLVHRGHCVDVGPLDWDVVQDPDWQAWSRAMSFTGTRSEIADRAEVFQRAGATELLFMPAGPDVPRELEAFAEAVRL